MRAHGQESGHGAGGIRIPVAVGVAAAATLGLALLIGAVAGLPASIAITGVANVFLAARTMADLSPQRRFAELPVVAVLIAVAALFGHLLVAIPALGALVLALAVAASVWARRFGPRGRRIGRLAAAPFVSVLIVPVPALAAGMRATLLVPLIAIAGQAVTAAVLSAARVPPAAEARQPERAAAPGRRRPAPSTRQAVQILVALLAAFAVGFLLFGRHWPWVVLTVYVVQLGARGRGDALLKAVERLGGAVGGTVVGMAVAAVPLPALVRVALILLVLVGALALRSRSYVWWAAGVTTSLALLYDLLGAGSAADLLPRIVAVLVGGALAVAASWFVLPIRTRDVLRRRIADALTAVQAALGAIRAGVPRAEALAAVSDSDARLEEIAATHRFHERVARLLRRPRPAGAAAIAAMTRIAGELPAVERVPGLGALERQVAALRRLNARRGDSVQPPLPPDGPLRPLGEALDALRDPLTRLR